MNLSFAGDAFVNGMSRIQTPVITDSSQCNPGVIAVTLKRFDSLHESNQILRGFAGVRRAKQGGTAIEGMWINHWRAPL